MKASAGAKGLSGGFRVCVFMLCFTLWLAGGRAQVVRDGTMGPPGPLTGPDFDIPHTDGTIHGNNLFHSFSEFNVRGGQSAVFSGPSNIQHLLSRVTGGSSSTIDGLLRTSGMPDVDVFLMNPAGVIFGPNAQLDLPGALIATTANVTELADGGRFAASTDPAGSVLTSAPPSAFGFLQDTPAAVDIDGSTLEMAEGQALCLIGGDLRIGGWMECPSGRVSILSVASPGEVTYSPADACAELASGSFEQLGDVEVVDEGISVAGDPGGRVVIRSGRLLVKAALMTAQTQGDTDHPGTAIDIHVGDTMTLQGTSEGAAEIAASSASGATGDAGDTHIVAGHLEITGEPTSGYQTNIGSRAFGAGDAGNVDIAVDTLTLNELCFISAPALGTGAGGDITIDAGEVRLRGTEGWAYISTLSQGGGASGNIDIGADRVVAEGGTGGYVGFTTQSRQQGTTTPGELRITAHELELLNGAQVNASLFSGEGNGGDIEIEADSILISGRDANGYPAGVFSSAGEPGAGPPPEEGKGGTIRVVARELELSNGGRIAAYTTGRGQGGDLAIEAQELSVFDRAGIYASSFGPGDGGTVNVRAGSLEVLDRSYVSATAFSPAPSSDAGELRVQAESIFLAGPASAPDPFGVDFTGFATVSYGGCGGNLYIGSESLEMTSRAQVATTTWGAGAAGDLVVEVDTLEIGNGANMLCNTRGAGDAGTVRLAAEDFLLRGVHPEPYMTALGPTLAPSMVGSEAGMGGGNAGRVMVGADRLRVLDGALISTVTAGEGDAGAIELTGRNVLVSGVNAEHEQLLRDQGRDTGLARSGIYSSAVDLMDSGPDTVTGDAGSISVGAEFLRIADRGRILSETETAGTGGNIALNVGELAMAGEGTVSSSSTGTGDAGTISVDAFHKIRMAGGAAIATNADFANAGDFVLRAGKAIELDDSRITARAELDGGNIGVTADDLVYLVESAIDTRAGGSGGNITTGAELTVLDHSRLTADAILGRGGNILIASDTFLQTNSIISASSEFGVAGTILVTSPFAELTGSLAELPAALVRPELRLADPCLTRFLPGASSFVVTGRDGLPSEPGAWLGIFDLPPTEPRREDED